MKNIILFLFVVIATYSSVQNKPGVQDEKDTITEHWKYEEIEDKMTSGKLYFATEIQKIHLNLFTGKEVIGKLAVTNQGGVNYVTLLISYGSFVESSPGKLMLG